MTASTIRRARKDCGHIVSLIQSELDKGATLALSLDDEEYRRRSKSTGSVGGHIRHNLDLVACFIKGLRSGVINYSARERDERVEIVREAAIVKTSAINEELRHLSGLDPETPVRVVSEVESGVEHPSTIGRELEFLHSHTVHHHALINEKISRYGIEFGEGFGVAPSTLEYWQGGSARDGR